jgi:nicotinate-nucleotide adenylyltransferase
MHVAFYGGSFNPPHVAHVLATTYLLSCFDVDRVMVVPVFEHALDKDLAPFEDRARMCELAFGWIPGVEVSRVEALLEPPNYTLNTLEWLKRERPDDRFSLVVGSDVLFERHKWHAFDRVAELAPPIVLGRLGFEHPEAPVPVLPEVSSSHVRELLGSAPTREVERELAVTLPRKVLAYARQHELYG